MIHPQHRGPMQKALVLLALLVSVLILTRALPPPPGAHGIAGYEPLHTLLETIAVVIACLVFAIGWNAYHRERAGSTVLLACAFLGVGLLDFSHALSFPGMPDYVTPSNTEKAIDFWLAARSLAALTLLTVAVTPWRPLAHPASRYLLLAAVLAVVAIAHAVILFRPQSLPRTFVPGVGLTPFKIAAEYALIALNAASAFALWLRMRTPQEFNAAALFVAVCTMALSEFFFTLYASATDIYNLMGHVYKFVSYLFLYRALFVETVERPLVQLRAAKGQLRATLETIPDLLWLKDVDGFYLDCNPAFERLFGAAWADIVGKTDADFVSPAAAAFVRELDHEAMAAGQPRDHEQWITFATDGYRGLFHVVKTPMRDAGGQIIGVLGIARDITAARAAAQAQRDSEERLRQAVRVARLGIFDHDHLADTLYWSPEQREIYGISPEVVMTLSLYLARVVPEDLERVDAAVRRAHDPAGDGEFDIEHRIVRTDGQVRFLSMRAQTQFAGAGAERRKLRTVGAVLDITERKRAEDILRASEESLAVTLQSIGDAVIATDLEGRVTRMNTVAERLTGWPLQSARGQPLTDVFTIVNASTREPVSAPVQRVLESGSIVALANHTMLLARDGREYHIADSAAPIRDAAACVSGVVLVFSDVSERYRAQQAMLAQTEALRLRDRALTQISQGVVITDVDHRITYVNPGFEQMMGYGAAEVIGRNAEFVQGAGTPPAAAGHEFRGEILNHQKDGTPLWIALEISPIRDDAGTLTGYVGALRDVTERRQAEAQRRSLETQLRESQKMESIGTLAGGIAHDFNNILGAILGNVALARGDLPPSHPALASLEQINKASLRARDLVQQILAFSRRQPQEMVTQPVRPLMEEALRMLRPMLPARIQLEAIFVEAPIHVDADATQIQQVLVNLCTNAWHALRDTTGRITLGAEEVAVDADCAREIGNLPAGRYAHLWVRDNGAGMDAQTQARIFEPFYTTKPPGQGTGLGLSVVHGIVAAHGGGIRVESEPGKGSTFHLYLPVRQAAAGAAPPLPAEPAAQPGRGEHVLYVDDDDVMVVMVERLLNRAGYRATCCPDARAALALVHAAPEAIDVLVTDYNMPSSSGLELAAAVRRLRPQLPLVISSGLITEELRTGARELGIHDVLQKQDTFEELPRLLGRILAR